MIFVIKDEAYITKSSMSHYSLIIYKIHNMHKAIIQYSIYPMVLALAYGLYLLLNLKFELNITFSSYLPIILALIIIYSLELKMSYRKIWIANLNDLLNDFTYMIVIQILLPKLLFLLIALNLLEFLSANNLSLDNYWFNDFAVIYQLIIMILLIDFFRYWIHRIFHENKKLWLFHAVHHSPHKLYSVNVGRFHFIDKSTQYLFDTLPFILLGVNEQVLALYYIFYSINGFFQHCNINIKLGFLNYIISGPELHRWHHSMITQESNNNYGNNLIIWDLLFGTWFLPKHKEVTKLGLVNRNYPLSFGAQLSSPFIKKLDKLNVQ